MRFQRLIFVLAALIIVLAFAVRCRQSKTYYAVNTIVPVSHERNKPAQKEEPSADIPLVIIGEGGTSGYLFQYAADTYVNVNGGAKYTVHDGDEFVAVMKAFVEEHGRIKTFVYFGHGNEVGLYVNQSPTINGALYVNDPALNEPYRAASIYDLPASTFANNSSATFYGCNIAREQFGTDSFAEQFANHFRATVIAPIGPTEFSFDENGRTSVDPNARSIGEPLYMIPTAERKGFVTVEPSIPTETGYDDVYQSMAAAGAIDEVSKKGLTLDSSDTFKPYASATYGDAEKFCKLIDATANCTISDTNPTDPIRNTAALKLLLDAAGYKLNRTNIPYEAQIYFGNQNNLLTPDFTHKKWLNRGEMAQLTQNILSFKQSH